MITLLLHDVTGYRYWFCASDSRRSGWRGSRSRSGGKLLGDRLVARAARRDEVGLLLISRLMLFEGAPVTVLDGRCGAGRFRKGFK